MARRSQKADNVALHPAARRQRLKTRKRDYAAPALDKGLAILELLAGESEPVPMARIAKALGRSATEIFRMLHVLEARGYIERDSAGAYRLTDTLFRLGMRSPPKRDLQVAALPIMLRLAEQTRQSCHLDLVSGDEVVVIASVEAAAHASFTVKLGYRAPLLNTASGRAALAVQPAERQREWLRLLREPAKTVSSKAFKAELARIAAQGYALEPSRLAEGVQDIAAPIAAAAACLVTPYMGHRGGGVALQEAIPLVVEAAAQISARLAGH